MNEKALAAQALSAWDRLEQGVKDGDKESIDALKSLIRKWAYDDFNELQGIFAIAFRTLMMRCVEGDQIDLVVAMIAIRCLAENEASVIFSKKRGG